MSKLIITDTQTFGDKAVQIFIESATEAISENGRFSIALSGGSTPKLLFTKLAEPEFSGQLDRDKIFIFWGDERNVPPDHQDSNFRMAKEHLLDKIGIPANNIYRIRGELPAKEAAQDYQTLLESFFGTTPMFDLILLGMGEDGHTASLFPNTEALEEDTRWVVENHVPKLNTTRITLSFPAINHAKKVLFLVQGTHKAQVLKEVLYGTYQPNLLPSQAVNPINGKLLWLVDQEAGKFLQP